MTSNSCASLGVDPGVRGGLALLRPDGSISRLVSLRPDMLEADVVDEVRIMVNLLKSYKSSACFFEKVGHMTGDGAQGSHTFGSIKGLLRGALLMAEVRPRDVYPQVWQAEMGCLTGGNKNVSKYRAMEIWPHERWTHAVADAALIGEYGRRRLCFS